MGRDNATWFPKGLIEAFKLPHHTSQNRYGNVLGVVSRGFVAEVHCPLSVWMEHGPRLVREHPIEVVRSMDVTIDRLPGTYHVTSDSWDIVNGVRHPGRPGKVPDAVFQLIRGHLKYPHQVIYQEVYFKYFYTREAALSALSDALIEWAKSQPVEAK